MTQPEPPVAPIDRSKRVTFDRVAADYDAVRPRPPEELVDAVIALSGIPAGGRILEIGCGPATATLPFAQRGYRMTCIELGPQLAALARDHCRPYPGVEIITGAFEEWPLEPRAYDLVLSVEAFHWIPPEISYPKAAAALKEGGSLALCWTVYQAPRDDLHRAIDDLFLSWAPSLPALEREVTAEWLIPIISENFRASGAFGPVAVRRFAWSVSYSGRDYARLEGTRSANQLEPEDKAAFLSAITRTVDRFGGRIEVPFLAVLVHAHVQR